MIADLNKLDLLYETFEDQKKNLEKILCGKSWQFKIKRWMDISIAIVLIVITSPIMIAVSILIFLSFNGNIFYATERVGYKGRYFKCFKFRSMISPDQYSKHDLEAVLRAQKNGEVVKRAFDSRVTRIGKIIRKTSIDELPQLFNVLKGDMGIVGPRPLLPFMVKELPLFNQIRSLVKPGITGKWQTENRVNNSNAYSMIKYDMYYVENFSLLLDINIILKTPLVIVKMKGAV